MINALKKGDTIRCNEDNGRQFTKGKLYTVRADWSPKSARGLILVEADDRGEHNGWCAEYFDEVALPIPGAVTHVLGTQIGGSHYTDCKIQPIEYIWANGLSFSEGNIIKYVTRWKAKGGIKDLEKAKHHLELLIEHEKSKA